MALEVALKLEAQEHYVQLGYDENTNSNFLFAAKNPGGWANDLVVAIIDAEVDQLLTGVTTTGYAVGLGVTQTAAGLANIGIGTTSPT